MSARRLRRDQARRLALGAQGFADARPAGRVDIRHVRRVVRRTGLLQIDSVNVVQRAHYVPLFSRLGAYDPSLLDEAAYRRRELFEYWVHEACLAPVGLHPLLRHRMRRPPGRRAAALMAEEPGYIDRVLAEVAERGPSTVADLSDPGTSAGPWWGWSKGKIALEHLFAVGALAVADRVNFVRRYDIADRVLPADVAAAPTPEPADAQRALLRRAARHLGVATADDLADYHRLRLPAARPLIADLVRRGELVEVTVDGWGRPAYLDPDAVVPRRIEAATVLSPFDPLVFHRPRADRLFAFDYRIEIYVPAAQRTYGYYVLPVLVDDRIVARADLKADRAGGRLLVRGCWWEDHADVLDAPRVLCALEDLRDWLGLDDLVVEDRGSGAGDLRRAGAAPAAADA